MAKYLIWILRILQLLLFIFIIYVYSQQNLPQGDDPILFALNKGHLAEMSLLIIIFIQLFKKQSQR